LGGRLLGLIAVVLFLAFATFLMVRLLPGDPAVYIASSGGSEVTPERIAQVKRETGLDKPFLDQFGPYVGHLATGHMGNSFQTREPVLDIIKANAPASLKLAAVAIAFVLIVSVVGGMLFAHLTRDGGRRRTEVSFTAAASVVGAVPDF